MGHSGGYVKRQARVVFYPLRRGETHFLFREMGRGTGSSSIEAGGRGFNKKMGEEGIRISQNMSLIPLGTRPFEALHQQLLKLIQRIGRAQVDAGLLNGVDERLGDVPEANNFCRFFPNAPGKPSQKLATA